MSILYYFIDEETRKLRPEAAHKVVAQKDHNADVIRVGIPETMNTVDLETSAVRCMYQRPKETEVRSKTATYYDTSGGYLWYDWTLQEGDTAKAGKINFSVCLQHIEGGLLTVDWNTTIGEIFVKTSYHSDDSDEGDETITPTVAQRVAVLESMIQRVASGAPIVVSSVSAITDTSRIYVLTTDGKWYYYDGSAWVAGGEYGGVAAGSITTDKLADGAVTAGKIASGVVPVVDSTLTQTGAAADAKATGDEITELKNDITHIYDFKEVFPYVTHSGFIGGDGNIQGSATSVYTDKITVTKGDTLNIAWEWEESSLKWVAFVTYDTSGTFIARNVLLNTTATSFSYDYTVPNNVGFIAVTYTFAGSNLSITKPIELPDTIKLPDSSVSAKTLDFSERKMPVNLFDYTSEDMCKPGWWYYSSNVGSIVSATQSGSTTHYVAIKVPVYDSTKITLGIYPNDNARLVYWVGAVDADMKLLAYSIVNQNAPVTYDLPTGTVYFLASYGLGSANFDTYLPRVMAVNADSITSYSPYFKPYYLLNGCKTEDYTETEAIQSIVGTAENKVKLKVPNNYDLVVGDTFQLFYKGIVNAVRPEMYYVLVDCAKGNAYSRYFEVTPDSAGNITATFTLFGINHNVLDTKTVTLAVHAKPSSPASTKNVLCVGDSLTTAGQWVVELHRRLTGSDGTPVGDNLSNINFIGTRVSNNVHYEGYGGWTIRSYNTENVSFNVRVITCTHDKTEATDQHSIYRDTNGVLWKLETIQSDTIKIIAISGEGRDFPNSGTLTWVSGGTNHSDIVYTAQQMAAGNPFWDSTANKVDFSKYATSLGVSSIDFVYVLIGWNSASWSESDYKADVQTFIDNVHASFPNAVIVFSGLEIPARDGLGNNYGATGTYSRYYDLMQFVFNLDKWYADVAGANSDTYSYNLSGQFDTEYNMLTATRPANTRNSTEVTYQSNGVHPALSGQMQIADAAYRDITARL